MARSTVIDSLLVVLGLDATPYKKGEADAEKSQKRLRDSTKKTSDEMSGAIKGVARQVGLLVLGFESVRGALSFLTDINNTDAALGRLATNTGTNVHELNQWGLAVQQLGGKAEAFQGDVSNLASSLVAMRTSGDVSPLLLLLQKAGVATQDAEGKTRNLFAMLQDLGSYLRQFNRSDAFQFAKNAGLSEDTLNLLLLEDAERKKRFADAERQNNLDAAAADRAQKLQTQWVELLQSARAFGRELLETVTPGVIAFFKAIQPAGESLRELLKDLNNAHVGESAATAINGIAAGVAALARNLPAAQRAVADFFEYVGPKIDYVADKVSRLVEVLNTMGSWFGTHVGVGAEVAENYFRANTPAGVDTTAGTQRSPVNLAQAAQARRQAAFAARQAGGPVAGGGGGTDVQIDQITITTQATDAAGIAAELPPALRRKGVVAQADTGMN